MKSGRAEATPALRLLWPPIAIAIGAGLATLIGGQVAVDQGTLAHGLTATLASIAFGSDTPILQHAVIASCFAAAWIGALTARRIVQIPPIRFALPLIAFFGLVVVSVGGAVSKSVASQAAAEWCSYGIALFAVVAIVGRKRGPVAVMTGIFLGCVILALMGIREYEGVKAIEPTHRIFGPWNNPNALGSILSVGLFLGLGLTVTRFRLYALACGAGVVFIGFAILLTQSKGAILVSGSGTFALCVLIALWRRKPDSLVVPLSRIAGCIAAVAILGISLQASVKRESSGPSRGAAVFGRLTDTGTSAEQSVGFRKNLQATSLDLIRNNPIGDGIGCFRFDSTRPGLVMQTVMAHNNLLQLGVELSLVAPGLFLVALAIWFVYCVRGAGSLPTERNLLRASVFVAVFGLLVDGWFESNLYYFGLGTVFFLMLGLGLLLAADAPTPEFAPKSARVVLICLACLTVVALFFSGVLEGAKATVRADRAATDYDSADATIATLKKLSPTDGEVWYLAGTLQRDPVHSSESFAVAVANCPQAKYYRALARSYLDADRPEKAVQTLRDSLAVDPNNLLARWQLVNARKANGDLSGALSAARSLVAVESTLYFKTRAIPEQVPTETYQARIFLASHTADGSSRADLLQPAVDGFLKYRETTLPLVRRFADNGFDYGGQDIATAMDAMRAGQQAATDLAAAYRGLRDADKAAAADAAAAAFAGELSLGGAK